MDNLNKHIEHTLLKQDAKKEEFIKLFDEAIAHNFRGVCVNPHFVKFAKDYLKNSDVKVITTAGFPLGANTTDIKAFEASKAVQDGADEVDMVINVSEVKEGNFDFVKNDIIAVKKACGSVPLKVILETDLLTKEEIKKVCILSIEAKADFVKTSTGFVKDGVGAKVEDVQLMYEIVSKHEILVKASGGIRDKEAAIKMLEAGASTLGTSSGVKIVS